MTADDQYAHAMAESSALLSRIKASIASPHPMRALTQSLWENRDNVPFMTTIYEASQEMLSPLKQERGR